MSYEVKVLSDSELPEELKNDCTWGPDYSLTLVIFHDGKIVDSHSDGGEPEDNSFGRDWKWVESALRDAYEKGIKDAAPTPVAPSRSAAPGESVGHVHSPSDPHEPGKPCACSAAPPSEREATDEQLQKILGDVMTEAGITWYPGRLLPQVCEAMRRMARAAVPQAQDSANCISPSEPIGAEVVLVGSSSAPLLKLLKPFLNHMKGCSFYRSSSENSCSCGFRDAMEYARAAAVPAPGQK